MNISKTDLDWAVAERLLSAPQADALWLAWQQRAGPTPGSSAPPPARFDVANLAYFTGALIVLGAMGWFMTLGWEMFGGPGIFGIAAAYAGLFVLGGRRLWAKAETRTAGGLLFTLAVGMTPLAAYGLERALGRWPQADPGAYAGFHVWVRGGWVVMELATVAAGLLALWRVRFPFLTAPVAFALWYLSMDLTPLLFGRAEFSYRERLWVSVGFGLAMLAVAYVVDGRRRPGGGDYAFWLYLFGLLAFWFGLTLMESGREWGRLLYALINAGLMLLAVLLDRRAFLVFGALGVTGYLGHLSHAFFKDSLLFPFVLSGFGVALIVAGVFYQRRRETLRQALLGRLPAGLRRLLPGERAAF